MAISQLKQEQEAPTKQNQLSKLSPLGKELSLETQVFLSFKHRTPNRYKLLDQLIRANVTPEEELTDKTIYLGEKAKKLLRAILKKLFNNEHVLLNHKYITKATRCKSDQNTIILKELEKILKIQFYRLYTNDIGIKFSRHYYIELHPAIVGELKDTGNLNSEFYAEKNRPTYTNRNIFNKDKDIDLGSNFLQNISEEKTQAKNIEYKTIEPQIVELPKESVKPVKFKKRLANERKKPTNAEHKARIYHFNQYEEPKNLSYHYPLAQEDCSRLQSMSGRNFDLNAMNELLLDMSKRLDNRFCSKAQFLAYFGKCLRYEMRDSVKTNNSNFRIKSNHTDGTELLQINRKKQVERYLAEVEQRAITHVSPENQLMARLANILEPLKSYELLSRLKDFMIIDKTMRFYLREAVQLSNHDQNVVLGQVQSIYSTSELGIEQVEYVVENPTQTTRRDNVFQIKRTMDIPRLEQGVLGEVCRRLIEIYGVHVYDNWFSKLTAIADEQNRIIELKSPNVFTQQWIETNYGETIKEITATLNIEVRLC